MAQQRIGNKLVFIDFCEEFIQAHVNGCIYNLATQLSIDAYAHGEERERESERAKGMEWSNAADKVSLMGKTPKK